MSSVKDVQGLDAESVAGQQEASSSPVEEEDDDGGMGGFGRRCRPGWYAWVP